MNDLVTTLMEAVRLSRRELDAFMHEGPRADSDIALTKLTAILCHRDVSEALDALSGITHSPPLVPNAPRHEHV